MTRVNGKEMEVTVHTEAMVSLMKKNIVPGANSNG